MRSGDHVFYNTKYLSMDEKVSMFWDCMEISYDWWADTLDCSVSYSRQKFDCTFEEILGYLFIQVDSEEMPPILDKYRLVPMD